MKQALTAAQLALLDTQPQRVELYAAIHRPRILAWGTLSAIPDTYPGSQVLIKNVVAFYNLSTIQAGMTLRVGSESNKDDYGSLRVREDYSSGSIIKTAVFGSGLVNFVTGACLTVVEDFRAWPIHHDYDTSLSTWLVDTKNYTSQLSLYGPQAIMGPPAVTTLDGGKAVVPYVGNLSYSHSAGASIASQAWAFPDGQAVASALGSSAAPVNITYTNASPYGRYHSLTVTDGNGASHISRRLTFAFSSHIDQQPARVSFESITGGLNAGGYRTRVTMLDNAPSGVINDGALVVIFEKASYGTAGSSVGGNYYGRENVVMVGRVVGESLRIEPFTNQLSFALETIDGELRRSNGYDLFLEGSSAASSWDMASNLTLDHAALALVKHRSTISAVTDFHPASGAAATNELYYRSLPAGTLWDQLTYNYAAAFGQVAADMQGTIWAGLDAQVTGLSANLPNVMAITKDRRMDSTTIEHEHHDANAQYRLYAIQGGAASPLGAESPGQRQGYYGGKQEVTRNLLVNDQDTLITWAGNVRAKENNPYKRVITGLRGNFRLDSVPQSRVTMSLSATDTKSRVDWSNKVFIPTETTLNYNNAGMFATTEVSLEGSVNGMGGSAITFPTVIGDPGDNDPTPPGSTGSGNLVYVATENNIGRTRNFGQGSATAWQNITGNINVSLYGSIRDFNLDPYDPLNKALVVTSSGFPDYVGAIWHTNNLDSNAPIWSRVADIGDFTTNTVCHLARVLYTIAISGRAYIHYIDSLDGVTYRYGILRSNDGGLTWTRGTNNASNINNAEVPSYSAMAVGNHNGNVVYCGADNGAVRRSTDGGDTWSTYVTFGTGAGQGPTDFECPYAGNDANDGTILAWPSRNSDALVKYDGSSTTAYSVTQVGGGAVNIYQHPYRILVATHDAQGIIALRITSGDTADVVRSTDGGSTWETVKALSRPRGVGAWPYDFNRIYLLSSDGSNNLQIQYSTDGGRNFADNVGNWSSAVGNITVAGTRIIPVWI